MFSFNTFIKADHEIAHVTENVVPQYIAHFLLVPYLTAAVAVCSLVLWALESFKVVQHIVDTGAHITLNPFASAVSTVTVG